MRLMHVRLRNFQSFGPEPVTITFGQTSFLIGPNGAGKTAVLAALACLFGTDQSLRRIRASDFHVPVNAEGESVVRTLWIEAQFEFPELKKASGKHSAIPSHFKHMKLVSADGVPRLRFRLSATLDVDGEIEETLNFVIKADAAGIPTKEALVQKGDRSNIQVHYLPARRDPADHISYAANAMLGRVLRAVDWTAERAAISGLTGNISDTLTANAAVAGIGAELGTYWESLHKGEYYAKPAISFGKDELDNILRHLTVDFTPGHGENIVDFARLSDGQQSLLYLSIVLSVQAIGRKVITGTLAGFDVLKLRPPAFTLIAMEEPENSLSPHYLGRVVKALASFTAGPDAQAVVSTHTPSILTRVPPEEIRYLRLDADRQTIVRHILLPDKTDVAHKFVREAVQAFPEIYFSRFVILGEGDSEEIVLPRLLEAKGLGKDESAVSVAPLGGRHVNHFWRLLEQLEIPYATLLDLDLARYQGGWGRVKYAADQLLENGVQGTNLAEAIPGMPKWNGPTKILVEQIGKDWLQFMEKYGIFFSSPLDLDFVMLMKFKAAYEIDEDDLEAPDEKTQEAVLGKKRFGVEQYPTAMQEFFGAYHEIFKLGSKPAAHISALAKLTNAELIAGMPPRIGRLIDVVAAKLKALPE